MSIPATSMISLPTPYYGFNANSSGRNTGNLPTDIAGIPGKRTGYPQRDSQKPEHHDHSHCLEFFRQKLVPLIDDIIFLIMNKLRAIHPESGSILEPVGELAGNTLKHLV